MSPHALKPPPPLPHSPTVPVPPLHPSNPPSSYSVTTTFPSFPGIEVAVPDPSHVAGLPFFSELIPERHLPWVLPALLPYVLLLQGPHLTQPLTHSSRWISETSILPTQTLPKAKVKAGKPFDKGKGKSKKGQGIFF